MTTRPPTDDEAKQEAAAQAEIDELSDEIEALYDGDEDEGEGEDAAGARIDALQQKVSGLENAQEAMKAQRRNVLPEVAALCGAVVSVGHDGLPAVLRNMVKKDDLKTVERATAQALQGASHQDGEAPSEAEVTVTSGLSEALCRDLTSHRTRALQALLIVNHRQALAALAHAMLSTLIYGPAGQYQSPTALAVRASDCDSQLNSLAKNLGDSSAGQSVAEYVKQCKAQLPQQVSELLLWLLEQELQTLVHLLALCAALSVNAISGKGGKHPADALAMAVNLDMAEFWSPTGPSYLGRVSKQLLAEAVSEAGMSDEVPTLLKMKKGEAVDRAASLLDGKRWLPSVLR